MRVTTRALSVFAAGLTLVCFGASFFATSCGGGGSSTPSEYPAPTQFTPSVFAHGDPLPALRVSILSVSGASGPSGRFLPGDVLGVEYQLAKDDGTPWDVLEMSHATALVSGPTFNYQRVIAEQTDVAAHSFRIAPGLFRYTFSVPIPSTYLPPLNDSDAFGPGDGELTGQALLDGTYTVGLSFAWDFTQGHGQEVLAGEKAADFLLGDSAVLIPREVVTQANCNRCHVTLRAHDGLHTEVRVCVLCHTAGAEDANDPNVLGGTPGVSVDARVLFHKIHDGHHLPSVVGITASADGTLDYTADPKPYQVVEASGVVHDYSHTGVAIGPGHWLPMPEDFGYAALSDEAKERDGETREGLTNCKSCHGDPDGAGPLVAPVQGETIYAEPQRRSCGACHDDVHWDRPYTANQQTMDPQPDDSSCTQCHGRLGGSLAIIDGHRHPLLDTDAEPHAPFESAFNPGLHADLFELDEWGPNDGDGTIDPGEGILLHFNLTDDAGNDVAASSLARITVNVSGPADGPQLLQEVDLPLQGVSGAGHFVLPLVDRQRYLLAGHSTAATGDVFPITQATLFNLPGAEPVVRVRTGSGGASALSAGAGVQSNFIVVGDASVFARDDSIVIDEGVPGVEEFLKIQYVDGQRLWFSSPPSLAYPYGLKHRHPPGAVVQVVTLDTKTAGVDYSLDVTGGSLTELTEFGDGAAVVVDATVSWQLPAVYPLAMNASDGLDETSGKWTGKPIVSGVYRVTMQARMDKIYFLPGQQHVYPIVSEPSVLEVGVIDGVAPPGGGGGHGHALPAFSETSCQSCHQDLWYHEGRERGLARCIACHGNAGIEDRPQYVSANAPATPGRSVEFRSMLHSIHMGSSYNGAQPFEVVGHAEAAYPDDLEVHGYEHNVYPAMPHGVAQCTKCHDDALPDWQVPRPRNHPTDQVEPVLAWRETCIACHASDEAIAHYDLRTTSPGVEACGICHGPTAITAVALFHHGETHSH